jgi:hypothetical protein
MTTEWLKVMLDEILRKKAETSRRRREHEPRENADAQRRDE